MSLMGFKEVADATMTGKVEIPTFDTKPEDLKLPDGTVLKDPGRDLESLGKDDLPTFEADPEELKLPDLDAIKDSGRDLGTLGECEIPAFDTKPEDLILPGEDAESWSDGAEPIKPHPEQYREPYPPEFSDDQNSEKNLSENDRAENLEDTDGVESPEAEANGLTDDEKNKIKEETGWSDEIIDGIQNMKQYEILKEANLMEAEIDGKKCLIKKDIDPDYKDEDGLTNRERMERGLAPLDSKTGKPIELHHLGQKPDSPLVELTEEEHRTGEYEDGKKNQSLWHDNSVETEVHEEGNSWKYERQAHWKARSKGLEE